MKLSDYIYFVMETACEVTPIGELGKIVEIYENDYKVNISNEELISSWEIAKDSYIKYMAKIQQDNSK